MNLRPIALGLLGAAVLLCIFTQFLPWKSFSTHFSGQNINLAENLWGTSASSGTTSQGKGYYDSDFNDSDGIMLVRIMAPLVTVAALGVVASGLLGFLGRLPLAAYASWGSSLALLVFSILFLSGLGSLNQGTSLDTGIGSYMVFTAVVLAAAGGVLFFMLARGMSFAITGAPAPTAAMPTAPAMTEPAPEPMMTRSAPAAAAKAPAKPAAKKVPAKKPRPKTK